MLKSKKSNAIIILLIITLVLQLLVYKLPLLIKGYCTVPTIEAAKNISISYYELRYKIKLEAEEIEVHFSDYEQIWTIIINSNNTTDELLYIRATDGKVFKSR